MRHATFAVLLLICTCWVRGDAPATTAGGYANDFQKAEVGKVPADMLVLNGSFAVRAEGEGRHLELAGRPIDTLGLLFGAQQGYVTADVRGRIQGTSRGKLFPEFGLGSNDAGGFKVWLVPGQNALELRKGDSPAARARVDYKWESGVWTWFRLRVTPAGGGKWKVEAKAWPASAREPEAWPLTLDETTAPPQGRASVWGQPYSDTAIRFDDLSVTPVAAGKG